MVVFLGLGIESLLNKEEAWSGQTRITTQKGHNFWSDCWIAQYILQEYPEDDFLGVAIESQIGAE
jgi:hypothetical protein